MKTIRVCRRCGAQVQRSQVEGYSYYCPEHDEDLYEIETVTVETEENESHESKNNG